MKKVYKIALVILIILNIYSVFFTVNATGDIWQIGNKFLNLGSSGLGSKWNSTEVNQSFTSIVDFLWGLGLLIVFVSTIVLGIKYMMVTPNEKSRIKQATTPYIMGVVIIFGAITIWKLIIAILEGSMLGG